MASVAPDVKMISSGSAPMRRAIRVAASAMAAFATYPNAWSFECGFPNVSDQKGAIAAAARGSRGVEAIASR